MNKKTFYWEGNTTQINIQGYCRFEFRTLRLSKGTYCLCTDSVSTYYCIGDFESWKTVRKLILSQNCEKNCQEWGILGSTEEVRKFYVRFKESNRPGWSRSRVEIDEREGVRYTSRTWIGRNKKERRDGNV